MKETENNNLRTQLSDKEREITRSRELNVSKDRRINGLETELQNLRAEIRRLRNVAQQPQGKSCDLN